MMGIHIYKYASSRSSQFSKIFFERQFSKIWTELFFLKNKNMNWTRSPSLQDGQIDRWRTVQGAVTRHGMSRLQESGPWILRSSFTTSLGNRTFYHHFNYAQLPTLGRWLSIEVRVTAPVKVVVFTRYKPVFSYKIQNSKKKFRHLHGELNLDEIKNALRLLSVNGETNLINLIRL